MVLRGPSCQPRRANPPQFSLLPCPSRACRALRFPFSVLQANAQRLHLFIKTTIYYAVFGFRPDRRRRRQLGPKPLGLLQPSKPPTFQASILRPACASTPPASVSLCPLCAPLCFSEICGSSFPTFFVSLRGSSWSFVSAPQGKPSTVLPPPLPVARLPRAPFSVFRFPFSRPLPSAYTSSLKLQYTIRGLQGKDGCGTV